jgi:hypothetical protein
LTEQTRAAGDVEHTKMIMDMRNLEISQPITSAIVNRLASNTLRMNDITPDHQEWLINAVICVSSNLEKHTLLSKHVVRVAIARKRPVFCWRKIIKEHLLNFPICAQTLGRHQHFQPSMEVGTALEVDAANLPESLDGCKGLFPPPLDVFS